MGGGGSRRGLRSGRAQGPAGRSGERGGPGRRGRLAGAPGRGTLKKNKPPILGLIQRGGQLVIRMLANVQQKTIQPVITATLAPDSLIYTDEYDIYARLPAWGYRHKTVCHSRGEYARDEDDDGFCEVHVNTMEGVWSLLRSWLRPHRGISQEKLPIYLGFFEFVHNARRRGKALLVNGGVKAGHWGGVKVGHLRLCSAVGKGTRSPCLYRPGERIRDRGFRRYRDRQRGGHPERAAVGGAPWSASGDRTRRSSQGYERGESAGRAARRLDARTRIRSSIPQMAGWRERWSSCAHGAG